MLFLALVVAGCAGNGQAIDNVQAKGNEQLPQEEQVASSSEDKRYEVICRRQKTVGSRLAERVCKTRYQIEKEREEAQEQMRREQGFRARKTISNNPASGGG